MSASRHATEDYAVSVTYLRLAVNHKFALNLGGGDVVGEIGRELRVLKDSVLIMGLEMW